MCYLCGLRHDGGHRLTGVELTTRSGQVRSRPMGRRRQRWIRLTLGVASGAMVITGALGLGPGSAARADISPGIGSSYAQSLQVTPHEGSLAVGVVLGEALAGHTNGVARAQSQGEDLGSIGLALEG